MAVWYYSGLLSLSLGVLLAAWWLAGRDVPASYDCPPVTNAGERRAGVGVKPVTCNPVRHATVECKLISSHDIHGLGAHLQCLYTIAAFDCILLTFVHFSARRISVF